jgi:hypothetical protein
MGKASPVNTTAKAAHCLPLNQQAAPMRSDAAYTPDLDAEICDLLSMGQSLRSICASERMPDERTVRRWVQADHQGFAARYAVARDLGMDAMADELLEIADDGTNDWMERQNQAGETVLVFNKENFQRSRLRFDARRWLMSKIASKRYGDKTAVEMTGANGGPVQSLTITTEDPIEAARIYQRMMSGE